MNIVTYSRVLAAFLENTQSEWIKVCHQSFIHSCCKVPFALQNPLKDELDRMENLEVIEKIDEPTEWVSSLVIVEKKNGKHRVCLDPRDLNRAIKRE